ncbi:hypothetical protein [Kitasatospora sp. NPDC059673]|uniref:hypothetical protein n=1 Tax=Kitasatospora sp. NPDC059673 TaxID=3346901 RepID=UPI003695503C
MTSGQGSGYRRCGSGELLQLVQVRMPAGAGVPLAETGSMLDAAAAQFGAALAEVGRQLAVHIDELGARRDRLHRLADGDRTLLPDRACAVLELMRELGLGPGCVAAQREALAPARAMVPEGFEGFLAQLEHRLGDREFVRLTKPGREAEAWDPGDPRAEERDRDGRAPPHRPRAAGGPGKPAGLGECLGPVPAGVPMPQR